MKYATQVRADDDDRLLTFDELEQLLAWYRREATDRHTGIPLFCPHGEHTGAPCQQCAETSDGPA